MQITRKEFLDLATRGAAGVAAVKSSFDFLARSDARGASAADLTSALQPALSLKS